MHSIDRSTLNMKLQIRYFMYWVRCERCERSIVRSRKCFVERPIDGQSLTLSSDNITIRIRFLLKAATR